MAESIELAAKVSGAWLVLLAEVRLHIRAQPSPQKQLQATSVLHTVTF